MKQYYPLRIRKQAMDHAVECYPTESCGLILLDGYLPCENVHPDPESNFKIDSQIVAYHFIAGDIKAVVHSHIDCIHATKEDMETQQYMGIPWGIINMKNENVINFHFFGDSLPVQTLKGRPFVHGIYDCYTLVRDYYRLNFDIVLSNSPREMNWWTNGEDFLCKENFFKEGFVEVSIDEIAVGDVVMAKTNSNVVNHMGVYTGNSLFLHQIYGKLSMEALITPHLPFVKTVLRHNSLATEVKNA